MLLGAHVPTAGGLDQAPARGREITADAIQVFTRNQVQWRARPLAPEEVRAFRVAVAQSGVRQVLSHGSYLVNLASADAALLTKSRQAFLEEMERCHALGIRYLVFHPGAHRGAGEAEGLRTVAASLNHVLERAPELDVHLLLEVTAGQGSSVGHRFEHLASIFEQVRRPERLGVCLDTCHLLAAGYDIATPKGYEATLSAFARLVGLDKLKAVHLNDAGRPLGSRRDRHAPIGHGFLGRATFRRLVNDPRFHGVPMVLETPGPLPVWKQELRLLRGLVGRGRGRA
ncbi:MAG TPA: deoxyribonuclease IV [Vicinamibacteria bacterium]|nr:deoxyribonuclease IV [Vicinamibacteria bacterium]